MVAMQDSPTTLQTSHRIELPAALDIRSAADLREILLTAPPTTLLDLSAVTRLTTPCIQLLAAAVRNQDTLHSCRLTAPSEAAKSAFEDLGFSELLQPPYLV